MNINDGILIADAKLDSTFCDDLILWFEDLQKENASAFIDNAKEYGGASFRQDSALFIDSIHQDFSFGINNVLNQALEEYLNHYDILKNSTTGTIRSVKQKMQKTPVGGGYHSWHYESATPNNINRVLVWTVYLNDIEEGGETEFLYYSERVKAEKGKVTIFPANYIATHRGNPPLSNEKYIVTGWYELHP